MGRGRLSKDKAGKILGQCVHVVATTKELRHSTGNFARLTGDYLLNRSSPLKSDGDIATYH